MSLSRRDWSKAYRIPATQRGEGLLGPLYVLEVAGLVQRRHQPAELGPEYMVTCVMGFLHNFIEHLEVERSTSGLPTHLHTPPTPAPSPQHQGEGFVGWHHGENCGLLEKKKGCIVKTF